MAEPPLDELGAIRKRARDTRTIIEGTRARANVIVETPALLDREALLRAIDAAIAAGGENVRTAILSSLSK